MKMAWRRSRGEITEPPCKDGGRWQRPEIQQLRQMWVFFITRGKEYLRTTKKRSSGTRWQPQRATPPPFLIWPSPIRRARVWSVTAAAPGRRADCDPCESTVQSRESHWAAQKRSPSVADAGRGSDHQRGLHGHGVAGLNPEGVVCVTASRNRTLGAEISGREADCTAHGVQDVSERLHPCAVPTRAHRAAHSVPDPGLEPTIVGLVPCSGCVGSASAMLT